MKTFSVYEHPALGLEALKVGFSWPALFLGILWMVARKLWSFLGLWLALYVALFMLAVWAGGIESQATQGWIFLIVFAGSLVLWLVPVFKGNSWREKNLEARGYEKVCSVQSETKDAAVAEAARENQQPDHHPRSTRSSSRRTTSSVPQVSQIVQIEPAMVRNIRSGRLLYYKHSGHFTVWALTLGLLSGMLVASLLAFVYSYGIFYIPFIYLDFFLTVFFGLICGGIAGMVLKSLNTRNAPVAAVIGLVVGLVALYVSWVVWIFLRLEGPKDASLLLGLAANPSVLWLKITQANAIGSWKIIGGATPTGLVMWIVWGIEALIITVVAMAATSGYVYATPYCEGCGTWCTEKPRVAKLRPCEPDELKQHLEKKDFAYLETVGPSAPGADTWFQISLYQCKQCGLTNTLEVKSVVTVKGKERMFEGKNILQRLLVTSAECESVCQVGQKLTELASATVAESAPTQAAP